MTGLPLFDICLSRHRGAVTSVEANRRVDKAKDRAAVLAIIAREGVTFSKAIAREMGKPLNCISGRITELKAKGIIQETSDRFDGGCAGLKLI